MRKKIIISKCAKLVEKCPSRLAAVISSDKRFYMVTTQGGSIHQPFRFVVVKKTCVMFLSPHNEAFLYVGLINPPKCIKLIVLIWKTVPSLQD